MRSISTASLNLLNGKIAIEPIIVVAITWVPGGQPQYYADKAIPDQNVAGKILESTGFDDVQKADGSGRNASVSITLDDTDGSIKNIFNYNDIHKRPVTIYQWFEGISWGDKFVIFDGMINTPIIWDEGKRSFQFDVVTKLESFEIGFDVSQGSFPFLPQELLGKGFPMVFGEVLHSKPLQISTVPTGFLLDPFGVPDPSLILEISKITAQISALKTAAYNAIIAAVMACFDATWADENALAQGIATGDSICNQLPEVQKYTQLSTQYEQQANELASQLLQLNITLSGQQMWERSRTPIQPTVQVLTPYTGVLKIGNNLFNGHIDNNGGYVDSSVVLYNPGQFYINTLKNGFLFYQAGTQVEVCGPYPVWYAVSITPGTVLNVYCYRSFNGLKGLVKLPTTWYTVQTLALGPYNVTCVVLNEPLNVRNFINASLTANWETNFGQYLPPHMVNAIDYEDQLYVDFQSTVGPNTVDIIKWIIATYCPDLTYDSTSFNAVHTLLANYPMNFTYTGQDDAISFISELAFQNRCAVWIKNNVFYIKYLPLQDTPVDSITEDDILVQSLSVTTTPTEDLITKSISTYRPDYTPPFETPSEVILRYNINKYGLHEESHDYFAFQNYYSVEKSATYWMIRRSNTFKILRCQLMLNKLNLETFDTVNLAFSHPYVANGTVPAIVQSAVYNPDEKVIDAEFWVPVRLGEMFQFEFAWPAGLSETDIFPPYRDILSGGAAGSLGGGQLRPYNSRLSQVEIQQPGPGNPASRIRYDHGDPQPSDQGDDPVTPDQMDDQPIPQGSPPNVNDDYQYPELTPPTDASAQPGSRTYPGVINGYIRNDPDTNRQVYACTVFPNGLSQRGFDIEASQLQLDPDDRIPGGTWIPVTINTFVDPEQPTQQGTNTPNLKREASFQVPIWLS